MTRREAISTVGCAVNGDAAAGQSNQCLEVIEVLAGFCALEKRSETLNGSIPLRAAQGCKPFLDGNAAGFQLRLALPAVLRKIRAGIELQLTDEGYAQATDGYAERVEQLVACRLLARDGYWHKELRRGYAWQRRGMLYLWTGYLIRPAPGIWLSVAGALNRRCALRVAEYVIPEQREFVPLVIEIELASLRMKETWLDTELACVIPLKPDVSFTQCTLKEYPEVGRAFCEFYDPGYLDQRADGKFLGRYRKATAHEPMREAGEPAECRLVIAGGPHLHRIRTFDRFVTVHGRTRHFAEKRRLQYAVVHNICEVNGRWDGWLARDLSAEMPAEAQRFRDDWAELYGTDQLANMEWLTCYTLEVLGAMRGEPFLNIFPWVFAVTPPGWSSLIDGLDLEGLDGMRGVVSTDCFFDVPPLWQYQQVGRFCVPRDVPLARVLPIPRRLLKAEFRRWSLAEASDATAHRTVD